MIAAEAEKANIDYIHDTISRLYPDMNILIWILLTGIMDFPISKRNTRHIIIQPWWQRYYRNYNFHERYMNAYKIPHREFESFGAYRTKIESVNIV